MGPSTTWKDSFSIVNSNGWKGRKVWIVDFKLVGDEDAFHVLDQVISHRYEGEVQNRSLIDDLVSEVVKWTTESLFFQRLEWCNHGGIKILWQLKDRLDDQKVLTDPVSLPVLLISCCCLGLVLEPIINKFKWGDCEVQQNYYCGEGIFLIYNDKGLLLDRKFKWVEPPKWENGSGGLKDHDKVGWNTDFSRLDCLPDQDAFHVLDAWPK